MRILQQKPGIVYAWLTSTLLICIACLSCEHKPAFEKMEGYPLPLTEVQEADGFFQLVTTDTLRMSVDQTTNNVAYMEQVKILGNDTLYFFYNAGRHNIQYYNLATGKREGIIPLQAEGPDQVPNFTGFYVHNLDSVFFVNYMPSRIYMVNKKGELANLWNFSEGSGWIHPELTTEYFYQLNYDPQLHAINTWFIPPEIMSFQKDYYLRKGICIEVYLDSLESYKTFGLYPENYTEGRGIYDFYTEIGGYLTPEHHVVYFTGSHEVHLYDRHTKEMVKRLKLKSEFATENIPPSMFIGDEEPDPRQQDEYMTTTPGYMKMMHNEDYSLHYRILKHGVPYYKGDKKRHFFDKPFSVAVYDNEFSLLTEKEFPGGTYDFYNSFAHGDRLYLSLNNELNEINDENYMQFEVHNLVNGPGTDNPGRVPATED